MAFGVNILPGWQYASSESFAPPQEVPFHPATSLIFIYMYILTYIIIYVQDNFSIKIYSDNNIATKFFQRDVSCPHAEEMYLMFLVWFSFFSFLLWSLWSMDICSCCRLYWMLYIVALNGRFFPTVLPFWRWRIPPSLSKA